MSESLGPFRDTILPHLDKSHVTVHTDPESHPVEGIATHRVDTTFLLAALFQRLGSELSESQFDTDIVTVDYRVRGVTRDVKAQSIHRSRNKLDTELPRRRYPVGLSDDRCEPVSGELGSHQDAVEGLRTGELSL